MKWFILICTTLFITSCTWTGLVSEIPEYDYRNNIRKICNLTDSDTIYLNNNVVIYAKEYHLCNSYNIPNLIDTIRYPQYKYYYDKRYWYNLKDTLTIRLY